jgi:putative membrane protein
MITRIENLPALNAILNSIASCFLLLGFVAIKKKKQNRHRNCMLAALACSALFLTFYLIYHFNTEVFRTYPGSGFWKGVYYAILITHIPLAGIMVPFILYAVALAFRKDFVRHVRVVKKLFPVWMYVSVTGVIIYFLLY